MIQTHTFHIENPFSPQYRNLFWLRLLPKQQLERLILQVLCSKEYYTICSVFTGSLSRMLLKNMNYKFYFCIQCDFLSYTHKKLKQKKKTTNDKNKIIIN